MGGSGKMTKRDMAPEEERGGQKLEHGKFSLRVTMLTLGFLVFFF